MRATHPLIAQLARERRRRGWSQTAAASRAGLSVSTVQAWETGALPTMTALQCYLDALGLRLVAVPASAPAPGPVRDGAKWCPECRRTLQVRDFPRDRSRKDGLAWRCRACTAEKHQRSRTRPRSPIELVES